MKKIFALFLGVPFLTLLVGVGFLGVFYFLDLKLRFKFYS